MELYNSLSRFVDYAEEDPASSLLLLASVLAHMSSGFKLALKS